MPSNYKRSYLLYYMYVYVLHVHVTLNICKMGKREQTYSVNTLFVLDRLLNGVRLKMLYEYLHLCQCLKNSN